MSNGNQKHLCRCSRSTPSTLTREQKEVMQHAKRCCQSWQNTILDWRRNMPKTCSYSSRSLAMISPRMVEGWGMAAPWKERQKSVVVPTSWIVHNATQCLGDRNSLDANLNISLVWKLGARIVVRPDPSSEKCSHLNKLCKYGQWVLK